MGTIKLKAETMKTKKFPTAFILSKRVVGGDIMVSDLIRGPEITRFKQAELNQSESNLVLRGDEKSPPPTERR